MKKIIKDYFTFSKTDRIAVIILLLLMAVFLWLPNFFSVKKSTASVDIDTAEKINALTAERNNNEKRTYSNNNNSYNTTAIAKPVLFIFDPNTLDEAGWIKIGISTRTAKTIRNYVSKGGKFKEPNDIRKIWGLRSEDADRIIPYIRIPENRITSANTTNTTNYTKESPKPTVVNINTATPQQLKLLPGLEYPLPYKIVSYREKLGGFLRVDQVKETYGITDSIFNAIQPYLQIQPTAIRKININTASDFDLGGHPYIDKAVAKAIVIYRSKHGNYKQVEDIKKIVFITQDLFNKIAPYLAIE